MMKIKYLLSIVMCLYLFFVKRNAYSQVLESDSLALVALYNSTNGSNWFSTKRWTLTDNVSTWYGIIVYDGRVTQIRLNNANLTGTIPPEIGNLTHVVELFLYDNKLTGTIPPEIGNLDNLENLDISNNFLTGVVPPEINNLTRLTQPKIPYPNIYQINLSNNFLDSLPLLGSIYYDIPLYMRENKFGFNSIVPNLKYKNDTIDTLRGNFFSYYPQKLLDTKDIVINRLGTAIELTVSDDHEDNIYQWFKDGDTIQEATNQSYTIDSATDDDFGDYWVTITNPAIPSLTLIRDTITLIDGLESDSLALVALYNATDGSNWKNSWDLSTDISTWYGVTIKENAVAVLNLYDNNLSGTIPPEIGNLTQLITLYLYENNLSGTIPPEIGNLTQSTNTHFIP